MGVGSKAAPTCVATNASTVAAVSGVGEGGISVGSPGFEHATNNASMARLPTTIRIIDIIPAMLGLNVTRFGQRDGVGARRIRTPDPLLPTHIRICELDPSHARLQMLPRRFAR